jgi:hypothetical protein
MLWCKCGCRLEQVTTGEPDNLPTDEYYCSLCEWYYSLEEIMEEVDYSRD